MRSARGRQGSRQLKGTLLVASVSIGLLLVSAFAATTPAVAQQRQEDVAPSELWKTYPLDPSKKSPGSQGSGTSQGQPASPSTETDTVGSPEPSSRSSNEERAQAAPESGSRAFNPWFLLLALVGPLILLVLVAPRLLVRLGGVDVRAAGRASGRLAHQTASPVRAVGRAAGHRARQGRSPARTVGSLPGRPARVTTASLRAVAGVPRHVLRRAARPVQAYSAVSRALFHRRTQFVFYGLAVVASVAVGILVAFAMA
jgi:hypothetical protein